MTSPTRRHLLQAAAATTLLPAAVRRALAIPAARGSGSIQDVQHVVILMQENRSFDHYFGTLRGVRGFGDRFTIPLPGGQSVWEQHNGRRTVLPYHLDGRSGNAQCALELPHSWPDAQAAWNGGRMQRWPVFKTDASMAYYREAELPVQFALANAFTLCDAYHCSLQGGTNPNRLFLFTGTNDPEGTGGGPVVDNSVDGLGPVEAGFRWTTYAERLQAAGVSWCVYQDMDDNFGDNPLVTFRTFRAAHAGGGGPLMKGMSSTLQGASLDGLRRDVLAGRLPQVSWVVAPAEYSEHPGPSTPVQGGWYAEQVLDALTADPAVWSRTVLLLMFDENDAFFDHMPPPAAPSRRADGSLAGKSTVDDRAERHRDGQVYGPGPRVPLWVISPWSRGGWVNSEVFDHTSVIRFLEARFGVAEPNISPWRRAVFGDLTSCFDFAAPDAQPPALRPQTKAWADTQRARQRAQPAIEVPTAARQRLPQQAAGVRPSRALPYRLDVDLRTDAADGAVTLEFINSGSAGAVFQVYDRLHLDALPRRYTVEAGKRLQDVWQPTASDRTAYDLWLLGPNGFHRRFSGRLQPEPAGPGPDVALAIEGTQLIFTLRNDGDAACEFEIRQNSYRRAKLRRAVPAGMAVEWRWDVGVDGHWYDLVVSAAGLERRYAGRVETGRHGISDPAMVLAWPKQRSGPT
ncbi:phosphocholine-specific phospholipase C [Roseateles asaccharophilus]|uniref:phospholipase C n=1 Tax=Roseateles asaccharophilus TaxID=582607 RepID=A0ABU2A3Z3_9BURK|nr:phospholipase C, phosphocholine-specific [Roseateles asaccharophilus]MDR7331905.1 phospholipase C [Roseateles asaccharophilus]